MKRFLLSLLPLCILSLAGCSTRGSDDSAGPVSIIFETDMGNDVDDAMALDLLFKYMDAGRVNLLGVMINKVEPGGAEYVDLARVWYGHPEGRSRLLGRCCQLCPACCRDADGRG